MILCSTMRSTLTFLGSDSGAMTEEQQWFAGKPEENSGLALAADTEAHGGHLAKGTGTDRAGSGLRCANGQQGKGGSMAGDCRSEGSLLRQSCGSPPVSSRGFEACPGESGAEAEAALAFAMAGDTVRAESLAQDLRKGYPLDTQMQSLWLPAIAAQLPLDRKNPTRHLTALQAASSIELGQIGFVENISCLYATYVRGEAYLAAGQGRASATAIANPFMTRAGSNASAMVPPQLKGPNSGASALSKW
jgi:hypothetical protein